MRRRWAVAYMRGLRCAERRRFRFRCLARRSARRYERRYGHGSTVCWDMLAPVEW